MADDKELEPIAPPNGEYSPLPKDEKAEGIEALRHSTNKRFANVEQVTRAIMFIAVISLVGIVVAVSGLVLDQLHHNSSTYEQRDQYYEDRIRLVEEQNNLLRAEKETMSNEQE